MHPLFLLTCALFLVSAGHTKAHTQNAHRIPTQQETNMTTIPTHRTLKNSEKQNVTVLGEGAWGTAIALLLADNGHHVILWCYDTEVAQNIVSSGYNTRYLPQIPFNPAITVTSDLAQALDNSTWIFETTPIIFLRTVLTRAKTHTRPDHVWVALSKGIEDNTLLLPTQIIADVLGSQTNTAACMGPSFAREVAKKQMTAVSIAAHDNHICTTLANMLTNDYFHPYPTTDVIGVQVAAALKNGIALGMGILEGAGYSHNTKAFFFTQALSEMSSLIIAMGGDKDTVYGLSGIGDTLLTSTSSQSKNTTVGRLFGSGQSLKQILQETGYFPEGVNTVKSIHQLMQLHNLSLPIHHAIHNIINGVDTVDNLVNNLAT